MPQTLTIIITPHGGEPITAECLAAARRSAGGDAEIIALDDSSPGVALLAETVNAKALPAGKVRRSAARNMGAHAATGEILLFIDSDVILADDAVPRILQAFERENCDAVVGCYGKSSGKTSLFSRYQDLFTCWHHIHSMREGNRIDWFWTPIGAVKRARFLEAGGFREDAKAEDVEFGLNLSSYGAKIILLPDATGEHRRWRTLWSYAACVFGESAGLMEAHLRRNRDCRFRTPYGGWRNIVTLPMSYFMFTTLLIGTFVPLLWWFNILSAGAALVHSFVINRQLYKFMTQGRPFFFRGLLYGAFVFYNHVGTNLIAGAGIAYGAMRHVLRRRRK